MNYESRIHLKSLWDKVMSADEAAALIQENMTLGFSGFVATGYPKLIPQAIAARSTAKNLNIMAGASAGKEVDGLLSQAGLVASRAPFNVNADLRKGINQGTIRFTDVHLGDFPGQVQKGIWGTVDFAIIECCSILNDGSIVPTLSAGASAAFVSEAKQVILELNFQVD